jgi:hypothetical protein
MRNRALLILRCLKLLRSWRFGSHWRGLFGDYCLRGRGPEPSRLGLRTTLGRPLVSLGFGGSHRAGRSAPAGAGVAAWLSLAAGETRISPLVQFFPISQAEYRQLLGIALPGSREAFEISANFPP